MLTRQAFWFLRHGETDWNARNLAQGSVDVPLNPVGRAQAQTAASLLANRGIRTIISSPLSRAHDTALAASQCVGRPVLIDTELKEVAFGDHEGQPMLAQWFDDWVAGLYTPPHAESFADLRTRVVAAINRALTHDAPVLIVAHGAVFRALRSAMGLPANVRTPNGMPLFCEPAASPSASWTLLPA